MSALDLFDGDLKIEHIQGYLYGMQEIENHILLSQGTTFEYSISNILHNQSGFREGLTTKYQIVFSTVP